MSDLLLNALKRNLAQAEKAGLPEEAARLKARIDAIENPVVVFAGPDPYPSFEEEE